MDLHKGARLLVEARERSKMKQADLKAASGVSISYISELERAAGKRPRRDVVRKLAAALRLSTEQETEVMEAYYPSGPSFEQPMKDRGYQRTASQVWVVSERPAELVDREYLRTLEANLGDGVRYTYWTRSPEHFDQLREIISGESHDAFSKQVGCIKTPTEANWFSFAI